MAPPAQPQPGVALDQAGLPKTPATSYLPLLVLLVIPLFCVLQMNFDHCVARRKRAREAREAAAVDTAAGEGYGGARAPDANGKLKAAEVSAAANGPGAVVEMVPPADHHA